MESLIDKIIEIDKSAKDKVHSASREADEILKSGQKEAAVLTEENNKKIAKRLSIALEQYNSFADEEIAEIEKKFLAEKRTIIKIMNENSKQWENEIIERITGNKYGL